MYFTNVSTTPSFFSNNDIQGWIFENIKKGDRWAATFATMLWSIWKCINNLAFNGEDKTDGLIATVSSQVDLELLFVVVSLPEFYGYT